MTELDVALRTISTMEINRSAMSDRLVCSQWHNDEQSHSEIIFIIIYYLFKLF